jgi:hypothetical protein
MSQFRQCCGRCVNLPHKPTCSERRRASAAEALRERYGQFEYTVEEWSAWLAGQMRMRARRNRAEGIAASQLLLDMRGEHPKVVGRLAPGLWGGL